MQTEYTDQGWGTPYRKNIKRFKSAEHEPEQTESECRHQQVSWQPRRRRCSPSWQPREGSPRPEGWRWARRRWPGPGPRPGTERGQGHQNRWQWPKATLSNWVEKIDEQARNETDCCPRSTSERSCRSCWKFPGRKRNRSQKQGKHKYTDLNDNKQNIETKASELPQNKTPNLSEQNHRNFHKGKDTYRNEKKEQKSKNENKKFTP